MELGVNGPIERTPKLPWGPSLDRRQSMALAKLDGATGRWLAGGIELAELRGYDSDPAIWGVILGGALRHVELGESAYGRLVVLAREMGADEDAAATHLEWLRHQRGL